jgi:hypothetical protein
MNHYALTAPTFQLYKDLEEECAQSEEGQQLSAQIKEGSLGDPWHTQEGLIMHGNQVFVPASSTLIPAILEVAHSARHGGVQKILHRLRSDFFMHRDRALVKDWLGALLCHLPKE